jgi:alkylated DNA repair dioxygenase AlkB
MTSVTAAAAAAVAVTVGLIVYRWRCRVACVVVNEYLPGQGIAPHIDKPDAFGDEIVSLSLGSAVGMEFSRGDTKIVGLLDRCSLLIMKGDARQLWKHGIAKRKSDIATDWQRRRPVSVERKRRVSITFRKVLPR